MEREVLGLQYEYERGLGLLDALGRTSPFIGALGGSAFTFAFGIIVAIPTIWFATNLRTKAALLLPIEMKISASQLTTYMEKINDTFYEKP
jgi:biopolymer transport protein ExbB/TolQ